MSEIKKHSLEGITIVLVGNQIDKEERVVTNQEGKSKANELGIDFFEHFCYNFDKCLLIFLDFFRSLFIYYCLILICNADKSRFCSIYQCKNSALLKSNSFREMDI